MNNQFVFDRKTTKETLEKIVEILEGKEENVSSWFRLIDENDEKHFFPIDQIDIRSNFAEKFPIRSTIKQIQSYEEKQLQEFIRNEIIPLDRLVQRVDEKHLENISDRRDALVIELLNWFKEEFFTWFDQSFCSSCSKSMKFIRFVSPTEQQRNEGDAQRAKLYR